MKKIIIILILILSILLTGCTGGNQYVNKIKVPAQVSESFYLPAVVSNDGKHDIYWQSSNKDVLRISNNNMTEIDGLMHYNVTVNRVSVDVKVVLTMTLEVYGEEPIIKEYEVTVLKITEEEQETIEFTFFAINDFHGSVLNDNGGISVIGDYIKKHKNNYPDTTIVLSSGDMFQGSAISNMTQGGVVVDCMNEIGFDAMAVGNHEFDWGVEIIEKYNNKTSDVKADFPIICCNIFEKETNEPVDWCEPYVVVQKGKYKIGIIGAIGSELESSIATNRIAPYEFKDPLPYIKEYSKKLRSELGCTLVVLAMHDNTTSINQTLADLKDEYQIDAVFNGHTHSTYAGETLGNDGIVMPYIQSGSSGSSIGKITLTYNKISKKVEQCSSENITVNKNLSSNNAEIDQIVNEYNEKISVISEEVIGVSGAYVDRITGARWAVNVIRDYSGCQIGFINSGGIRQAGFPIEANQNITVGKIWEIMPFDNFVKTCTMTTQQVIKVYNLNDILHSDNVEVRNGKLYYNGQECSDDQTFTVAAVDYIFDKTEYPFLQAQDQKTTGELFRDYLIQAVKDECKDGGKWLD